MPERFEIKKGAPKRRPRSIYPFEDMVDIGDHFDAPDDMGNVLNQEGKSARRHSILSSARNFALRNMEASFKVSTTIWYDDRKQPFVRCQRVSPTGLVGEILEKGFHVRKATKAI